MKNETIVNLDVVLTIRGPFLKTKNVDRLI